MATEADRLAAALYGALVLAHPVYGNTTGWRGGIGGQAITAGCSLIDGNPKHVEPLEKIDQVLRDYLTAHPGTDLNAVLSDMEVKF